MQTANTTGRTTGTTDDEPNGNNSGDCVFCGSAAEGIDAQTRLPVCRECGADLDARDEGECTHQHVRRFGRTDATGEAVIERRCIDCGRTVSVGGAD